MHDRPGKRRSAEPQKRRKGRTAGSKNPVNSSSGKPKAVFDRPPGEDESRVRKPIEKQTEIENENARLRESLADLRTGYDRCRSLLDAASVSLLAVDKTGKILESNLAAARLLGREPSDLSGRKVESCLNPDDRTVYKSHLKDLWNKNTPQSCEIRVLDGNSTPVPVRLDSVVSNVPDYGLIHLASITGIADQREAELKQDLAADVLKILNRGSGNMTLLIREVLRLIQESIGFDAVGLRLRRGEDYPYYEQNGFSDEFLYRENYLCSRSEDGTVLRESDGQPVLECTCGLVLSGKTDSSEPFFTKGGSFWTNCAAELLSLPEEADPRTNPRNHCIHNGYSSVALIPVHSGHEIIGLLQLNDYRENRLNRELVRFFEGLGDQIGMTLQRKLVEDALRQNQQDLNRAQAVGQIGSWRLDVGHNVLTWSDENHRIFGIPKGTPMTYETFLSTVHEDDRGYVDTMWKAALRGEPYDIEHRIRVNGEAKWVREKAYLEFDDTGRLLGGFGITQDITSRKQVEEELRILNESLERRVAERSMVAEYRTEQLQKLTLELTLAEQRERQRLAMVLHDGLQQILVGAKIQLGFVKKSRDIHQAVEQVTELIDDAIETSRSLSAELSPPILLQGDLILALEWLVRWKQNKYGLNTRLIVRKKVKSPADEITLLLFQSLRELLFNVVKHAGVKEATVTISEDNGSIEAIVEDEGRGFDPAGLRAEGGESQGIGLFGIRERLTYFGGVMEIQSAPGKGSRFKITLPRSVLISKPEHPDEKPERDAADVPGIAVLSRPVVEKKKIRVLLADDHIVMRQGLSRLLRGEPDIEVVGEASDGKSAVSLVRETSPDVILMDINMPGMGGIEAARIIHEELPEIRIIGLSMFQENERADAMRKAGAVGYIVKSGPSEAVVAAIRDCVEMHRDRET
ncbi:MAG: response regulator [Acidobacteria bacterium]|nr:response regulator [Acidobacteriota bacterium]